MIQSFSTVASSIFLEGLFFLLIGTIISGFIEVFVSKETIANLIPKNRFLGLLVASTIGIIFPICECGIVPVVRKLLKKGVPLHMGVALLFSSPLVNIIVITSTYFAFQDRIEIVFFRLIGGFIISFTAGLIVSFLPQERIIGTDERCSCCHSHNSNKLLRFGENSINEFFDTGKYFIIGILITSLIQVTVPRVWLSNLGQTFPISNIFMMFFPYVLSICSNTDAFIARSFITEFNPSAILSFLIFGAMFDIKTTVMLKKVFRKRFVLKLLLIVFVLTLIFSIFTELYLGGINA